MATGESNTSRLSQILTPWSELAKARTPGDEAGPAAQAKVLLRYCPAIERYLLRLAGDRDLADELIQEFALRLIRGDFRHVAPERGRFRDYVKVALRHLVYEYRRRGSLEPLPSESQIAAPTPVPMPDDELFLSIWKTELLDQAWSALKAYSAKHENHYYDALRLKADHPDRSAEDVAALLTARHRKRINPAVVRQWQHRGREKYIEYLRDAVLASLPNGEPSDVDDELADLGLLAYIAPA